MEGLAEYKKAAPISREKENIITKESIKEKKERKEKREKYITKGNINRWIFTLQSPEDTPDTEILDCLIEIFDFFSDSSKLEYLNGNGKSINKLISALHFRSSKIPPTNRKFCSLISGIVGNFAKNSNTHIEIFASKLSKIIFANLKLVSIEYYRQSPEFCPLLLHPFVSLSSSPELEGKKKKKLMTKAVGEITRIIKEVNDLIVDSRELLLISIGCLSVITESFGMECLPPQTISEIGNVIVNWVGDKEVLYHICCIIYAANTTNNDEVILSLGAVAIMGLCNTVLSRYSGSLFEEDEQLIEITMPLLSFFTWVSNPSAISPLYSERIFSVFAQIIVTYHQNIVITQNILNILYGCLERGNSGLVKLLITAIDRPPIIPLLKALQHQNKKQEKIVELSATLINLLT